MQSVASLFISADKIVQQSIDFDLKFSKLDKSIQTRKKNLLKQEIISHMLYKPNNLINVLQKNYFSRDFLINLYKSMPENEQKTRSFLLKYLSK